MLMGRAHALVGQQKHSAGAHVQVGVGEIKLVVWGEPVSQREAVADRRSEFRNRVAEVVAAFFAIISPVAGSEKDVEGTVGSQTSTGLPDASQSAIASGVPDCDPR